MKLLEKYFYSTFSSTFFPIFITLYIITSIIFLVKIAALTSIIQMNFMELMQLYSYSIPTLLFYTLPISYFVSAALSLAKLSSEYELIVITSFGLNPRRIVRMLMPTTISVTLLLLVISLGLIPKAKYLKESFLDMKKQEAQFNIKASEYGQQFGSWLIYVNQENDGFFQDITLLKLEDNKDTLISAGWATMKNEVGNLNLKLQSGKSFVISDTIQQVDFEKMLLNNKTAKPKEIHSLNDFIMYWNDRKTDRKKSKDFTFNILVSLFPLASIFFVVASGYFNPRYDKNRTTIITSTLVIVFVIISNQSAKLYPNMALAILPISWFIIGFFSYYFTTKKLY